MSASKPRSTTTEVTAEMSPANRGRHVLPFAAVLMCVLFFQGCQNSSIRFSTGPLAPILRLDYVVDAPLDSKISHFAPHWLALNLCALAVLFYWLPRCSHRSASLMRSWEFHGAMYLTAVFFNSILYSIGFWQHAVVRPIHQLASGIVWVFGDPDSKAGEQFILGLSSRLYFAFCWGAAFAALVALKWGFRRYALTDPDRWWQFNLRALLALTFVIGTVLGMALRLLQH